MDPTTVYRGHTIRWSDNSDEWTCYDLSDKVRSSPKLSRIKAAIDRLYLAERKANATPCYELSQHGKRIESTVVEYLGARTKTSWTGNTTTTTHKVAVVAKREGSERPSRREAELTSLAPATPEVERAYSEYLALKAEAQAAADKADRAFKAIPRLSLDDIEALVRLEAEGGDQ